VAARPAHIHAELDLQSNRVAVRAVLGFIDPSRMLSLADRAHEDLLAVEHRARPGRRDGFRRILLDAAAPIARHTSV